MSSLNEKKILENIVYINLREREDRKSHLLKEFQKLDLNPVRFEAIKNQIGAIGCTQSHISVLKMALEKNWEFIFVVEDDFTFLDHNQMVSSLKNFLNTQEKEGWDVLIISGNNFKPYQRVNESYIRIQNCQTTTGYIVNKSYLPVLINNFEEGLNKLINTRKIGEFSLDIYWKNLQCKDRWFMLTPINAYQYDGYSDILKRQVKHSNEMLYLK